MATQRGGVALVFEGHRYNKVRDGKDGTVYWRCSRDRQCPGRAVTVNNRVKKANNKHNHPPEASLRNGSTVLSSASSSQSQQAVHQPHHTSVHTVSSNSHSPAVTSSNSNAFTSSIGNNCNAPLRSVSSTATPAHHEAPDRHSALHDVLLDAQSAAAAAASFPAIVTETLKYLAAASGNHQMAAAFANSIASLTPGLKHVDYGRLPGRPPPVLAPLRPVRPAEGRCHESDDRWCAARDAGRRVVDQQSFRLFPASLTPVSLPADFADEYSDESIDDEDEDEDQPLNMAIRSSGQSLKRLRALMRNLNYVPEVLHAYVIPSGDAHQSEYIASCDKRRQFISGFTGSAGTAIVTSDDAALWTDGRYFLQAGKELDSNWRLMKDGVPGTQTQSEWLCKVLPPNSRVGVDPFLLPFNSWKPLSAALEESGHVLVPVPENLVDQVWDDRPPPPQHAINPLEDRFTGRSWADKISDLRQEMDQKKARALVLTALDDIAYLYNLRGSDIAFNPVFFAYTVITNDSIYLFVDETKLTPVTRKHLNLDSTMTSSDSVELRPYKMVKDFLKWLVSQESGKIWVCCPELVVCPAVADS